MKGTRQVSYVFRWSASLFKFNCCRFILGSSGTYRVSQEECARLRESVPYVKVYRYNPKQLYSKLNGYGDNGLRKVGASCGSKYCNLHSWCVARQRWWPWECNAVLIVPAWLLVACTGVGSAMWSAWSPKNDHDVNASVYIVQFNGFMSLIR